MTQDSDSFSSRRGYDPLGVPITVREGAPTEIRQGVLHFALNGGLHPLGARSVIMRVLSVPPEPDHWGADSNLIKECQRHLASAQWFEVYDVAEAFAAHFARNAPEAAAQYEEALNKTLARFGVGWKLRSGKVESRGSESFETEVARAQAALEPTGFAAAAQQIHEALRDLSRRPHPDLTGAVHHALGGLEAVAREITGQRSSTLGQILRSEKELFPPPLGDALEKIWGFASEKARHVREGDTVSQREAELLVGLSAVAVTYLCAKAGGKSAAG